MELELHAISKWNRATIADGNKLNASTISPLFKNDCILASAICDYAELGEQFKENEYTELTEVLEPSAENYESNFGIFGDNSAKWNSNYNTTFANSAKWDSTYTIVSGTSGFWDDIVPSATSGAAASGWLSTHSLDGLDLETHAISYAPDEKWNAAANNSMLMAFYTSTENNFKNIKLTTITSDQTLTFKGRGSYNGRTNANSVIATHDFSAADTADIVNSLTKKVSNTEYGTTNSVAFTTHQNNNLYSTDGKTIDSLTNSFAGTVDLDKSLVVGKNNTNVTNTVSLSVNCEADGTENSILSFKGANIRNCIAIKGGLQNSDSIATDKMLYGLAAKDYENVPNPYYYSRGTYDMYLYENSYVRNIKGSSNSTYVSAANCYPFLSATQSIVMTENGIHVEDKPSYHTSATNSIIEMTDYDITKQNDSGDDSISISNSYVTASSCAISASKIDSSLICNHNFRNRYEIVSSLILNTSGGYLLRGAGGVDFNTYTNSNLIVGGCKNASNYFFNNLQISRNAQCNGIYDSVQLCSAYYNISCVNSLAIGTDFKLNGYQSLVIGSHYDATDYYQNSIGILTNGIAESNTYSMLLADYTRASSCSQSLMIGRGIPDYEQYSLIYKCYDSVVLNTDYTECISNLCSGTDKAYINGNVTNYQILNTCYVQTTKEASFRNNSGTYNNALLNLSGEILTNNGNVYNSLINTSLKDTTLETKLSLSNDILNGGFPDIDSSNFTGTFYQVNSIILNSNVEAGISINTPAYFTISNGDYNSMSEYDSTNTLIHTLINGNNNKVGYKELKTSTIYSTVGPVIIGSNNKYSSKSTYADKNNRAALILGNNYNTGLSYDGGLHIGPDMDYVNNTKMKTLMSKLSCGLSDIFSHVKYISKPFILSKEDGPYFVCFKGLANTKTRTHIYFRKTDDTWYDVIEQTSL